VTYFPGRLYLLPRSRAYRLPRSAVRPVHGSSPCVGAGVQTPFRRGRSRVAPVHGGRGAAVISKGCSRVARVHGGGGGIAISRLPGAASVSRAGGPFGRSAWGQPGTFLTRPGRRGRPRFRASSPRVGRRFPAPVFGAGHDGRAAAKTPLKGVFRVRSGSKGGDPGAFSCGAGNAFGPARTDFRAGPRDPERTRRVSRRGAWLRAFRRGPGRGARRSFSGAADDRRGRLPDAEKGPSAPPEIPRARRLGRHSLGLCLGGRRHPAGADLIIRIIESATPADRGAGRFETGSPHLRK
jgi:hypothetical protein